MAGRWLMQVAALWAAASLASMPHADAQAIPPGAVACGGCHPRTGDGVIPPLAGMPSEAIESAMRAFRSGERPATVMDRISKGFSDEEVRAIADWFAKDKQP